MDPWKGPLFPAEWRDRLFLRGAHSLIFFKDSVETNVGGWMRSWGSSSCTWIGARLFDGKPYALFVKIFAVANSHDHFWWCVPPRSVLDWSRACLFWLKEEVEKLRFCVTTSSACSASLCMWAGALGYPRFRHYCCPPTRIHQLLETAVRRSPEPSRSPNHNQPSPWDRSPPSKSFAEPRALAD